MTRKGPPVEPDATWGHLTLRRDLGVGPRDQVYRAWDPELAREVALVIAPDVRTDPSGRDIVHEARQLARVRHPNLAAVYGAERRGGRAGVWMELVDGETLASTLRHAGRFSAREAALIGIDVCGALAAMHGAGIAHGELSARQVLRDRNGRIVVVPFGAARESAASDGPVWDASFDHDDVAFADGPLDGGHGGRQSVTDDIHRVGLLLSRLVAGEAAPGLPRRPLTDVRSDLPLEFVRTVDRALAADPDERHPSAAALQSSLSALWAVPVTAVQPPAPRVSFRWLQRAALAALVVAVGMAAGAWLSRQPRAAEVRFDIQPEGEAVESVGFSHQGTSLAYTAGGKLRLRRLADEVSTTLAPLGARNPFFSADDQWVYYFNGVTLWRVRPGGGDSQPLAPARRPSTGAAGPDGSIVYSVDNGLSLMVIPPNGRARVLRAQLPGVRTELRWPSLPGDGSQVLYSAIDARTGRRTLYLGALSAPPETRDAAVLQLESNAVAVGQHVFYVTAGDLVVRPLAIGGVASMGPPVVLARGIVTDPYSDGQVELTATATGALAYVGGQRSVRTLRVVDARGRPLADLTTGDIRDVRVSPTGEAVAYEQVDETTGGRDIWVVPTTGGTPVRLSRHPGHDLAPAWSPDGRRVYYLSRRDTQALLVSAPAASGAEAIHFAFEGDAIPLEITRDGRALLYQQQDQESGWDIWMRPLDGGASAALVRGPASEQAAAISPDGRWIAYSSPEAQGRQIYVEPMPADGRRWRVSEEHGRQPLWSADGRTLFFHGHERLLMRMPMSAAGPGASRTGAVPLFTIPMRGYDVRYHYGVLPDGGRFVVNVPPPLAPPVPATVILNARLP